MKLVNIGSDDIVNGSELMILALVWNIILKFQVRKDLIKWDPTYLIPIKIYDPLIFAHLTCGKIKGSKFAQYESAKIKARRKNATNEWKKKTENLQ